MHAGQPHSPKSHVSCFPFPSFCCKPGVRASTVPSIFYPASLTLAPDHFSVKEPSSEVPFALCVSHTVLNPESLLSGPRSPSHHPSYPVLSDVDPGLSSGQGWMTRLRICPELASNIPWAEAEVGTEATVLSKEPSTLLHLPLQTNGRNNGNIPDPVTLFASPDCSKSRQMCVLTHAHNTHMRSHTNTGWNNAFGS